MVDLIRNDERAHSGKWNGDPHLIDNNDHGKEETEPTPYLLPYWMGRYYHLKKDY